MASHRLGAQTKRRDEAGLGRDLLGGRTSPALSFVGYNAALRGLRLLPFHFQFCDELLKVFPLAQGVQDGVFLHVCDVLVALAHRFAQ